MKGGKSGRTRRSTGGAPVDRGGARTGPKKGSAARPANVAPPKGSRKKPHYGGTSTTDRDETQR
jgi:hypothetical protein